MLTISKPLGSAQALNYFEEQYTNTKENYYTQSDSIEGRWFGKLAGEFGLKGEISRDQMSRLVEGQDTQTGRQLIKHVRPYTCTNKFGEKVTTRGHRAGWDLTFSAPKTISLAALVGGDERLKEAHRRAVEVALSEIEKDIQARMGGNNPAVTTGKMLAALFEHDTSRPDKNGFAAAQLHTHCLTFNLTRLEDAKWRALQPAELFAGQQYATSIYRTVLAELAQKLGYEIEIDHKTGAPEIPGFSQAYLDAHSQRSKELRQEAQEMKARLNASGIQVKEGAGLRQAAATANRRSKKFNKAKMLERHQELDRQHDNQARNAVDRARARGPIEHSKEEIDKRAKEAVTFGRDHVLEREAVADRRDLIKHSLRRNMGLTTYAAVKEEIARREQSGEIIRIERKNEIPYITSQYMLDLERSLIEKMKEGKGTQPAVIEAGKVKQEIQRIAGDLGIELNESQKKAIEEILTNRDQIAGLHGKAGTGKTTVLGVIKIAFEKAGYEVSGFAPTTRAAALLSGANIQSMTLQMFLHSQENGPKGPQAFILDESSLTGSENMRDFFNRLRPQDRVLLVGDDRQHQSISAGAPFEQLQGEGMSSARLEKIIRQKEKGLLEAVENISNKKIKEGVKLLIGQGRVTEIAED
ncbi:MAG: relaxase domain-containing protein, partial [Ktedonobacteraceae bacterium]|nr:relaxase domain-containing protein [Ktedonobacteraceae bacterium]